MNPAAGHAAAIRAEATALGFDACAIAVVDGPADPEDHLGRWLEAGYQADMAWMAANREVRQDIRRRLPGARAVVTLARSYRHPDPPQPEGTAKVARYARGRDYHKVLKAPLRDLARFICGLAPGAEAAISLDTAPVLERTWAERAGLAWIGKNSLALRRDLGSWFFLATIATTLDLAPDDPMPDRCGSCTACLDACPTDAFPAPRVLDARRCIAYQTIENRGDIPEDLQPHFEGWVFGCDICQEVCPWNRRAAMAGHPAFAPRPGVAHPDPAELAALPKAEFDARFQGTPVRRATHPGMQRNARILLGLARRDAG
jgi:epoxyqueuosine reductase